jgi:hypothetical protein
VNAKVVAALTDLALGLLMFIIMKVFIETGKKLWSKFRSPKIVEA